MLTKVTGPAECTRCGYEGSREIRRVSWGEGKPASLILECDNCGKHYPYTEKLKSDTPAIPANEAQYFLKEAIMCDKPGCGGATQVKKTENFRDSAGNVTLKIRSHKCVICKKYRKTVEPR